MRLLLINPLFPESFWSSKWTFENILRNKSAVSPPLGLATLAALCPAEWEVEIIDENIESIPLDPLADIIGICGMGVQYDRSIELIKYFRDLGKYVIAGGSYASLCPEKFEEFANSTLAGEAEYIFPEFCRDFERGEPKRLYHETNSVDLTDSPTPRFDLLKLHRYAYASLQFSRGCPFRCEFCDIIVMFGRKPRVKSFEQVGRELDRLREAGVRNVFFIDDNLIGNLPVAKKFLQFLADYQSDHDYRFSFGTEASLNMAQHEDLLRLFRSANFGWVFIGIESTNPASLKETLKTQNLHEDIQCSLERIYAHGIEILAGFIIGFDNDTMDVFDQQYELITKSGIQSAMIGLLTALPKTPLYDRLNREGRLNTLDYVNDNTCPGTNVIPKSMKYDDMVDGYINIYERLFEDREIAKRIRNKIKLLNGSTYESGYSKREAAKFVLRLFWKGIIPGGLSRIAYFFATIPITKPSMLATVISDWVTALSMHDFAVRHLSQARAQKAKLEAVDKSLGITITSESLSPSSFEQDRKVTG